VAEQAAICLGTRVSADRRLTSLRTELALLGFLRFETVHRRKDGSTYPVEINVKRVVVDRIYSVTIVRDISERKRVEEALRQKETELVEAQRVAQVGSWRWDATADVVVWSEELYRIAGRGPNLLAVGFKQHPQLFILKVGNACATLSTKRYEPAPRSNRIWRWSALTVIQRGSEHGAKGKPTPRAALFGYGGRLKIFPSAGGQRRQCAKARRNSD
jgi:PAS domain-containing protein